MFATYSSGAAQFRDKRADVDPKDFMFDGIDNSTATKASGTVNGQQFIIQNCKQSKLAVFDHSASVTIDDCSDCQILIGPCKGSIFIRDCKDCHFIILCQQFRTRDCKNLKFLLHCATQPIIESSSAMRFACLQLSYPQLIDQINQAGLSVFNNLWGKIHDFTPVTGEPNFALMAEEVQLDEYLGTELISNFNVTSKPSVIPLTLGPRRKPSREIAFLMIFLKPTGQENPEDIKARCLALILAITQEEIWLVQSKEIKMQPSDIERILGTKKYAEAVEKGPVVSLEFCGSGVHSRLKNLLEAQKLSEISYLADSDIAASQSHSFYNYYDMQMGI